ncbi:hypothetical protein [Laspinema palackyanum]|uniref:hypothetical protein n=1 Tax=Laspinema palackyanum TaxID=3231601 RepID=UPI00349FC3BB
MTEYWAAIRCALKTITVLSIKLDKLLGYSFFWHLIGVHSMKTWRVCRKKSHEVNIKYLVGVVQDIERLKTELVKDSFLSRQEKIQKINAVEVMESQSKKLLKSNTIRLYQLNKLIEFDQ